ncbi:MAG: hypothetical protein JO189_16780 [Deltaproteobacteria bacterium]|nr:hypothetical protein [Deltaproteobacteria bacterium]
MAQLISELTREGTHIPLFALSREEAAEMIEARKGAPAAPKPGSEIYQATAGNPLFINGLVRVIVAEDRLSVVARLDLAASESPTECERRSSNGWSCFRQLCERFQFDRDAGRLMRRTYRRAPHLWR